MDDGLRSNLVASLNKKMMKSAKLNKRLDELRNRGLYEGRHESADRDESEAIDIDENISDVDLKAGEQDMMRIKYTNNVLN